MDNSKQIKIGAILSYFSIVFNIVVGLLYTPWMVAQIGEADYGLYTLANSLITLFLVDFGLSSATSRYVAKYRAEGRQDKVDSFLGAIYKLYLLIDAVIFVILLVIFFFLGDIYVKLTPVELERFKVVYIIVSAFAIINFPCMTFNGIINAYEKFIPLKLADVIYRVLLVGVTVLALILGYGLYALVSIHAIVGLVIIVYKLIVIFKLTPVKVAFKKSEKGLYKDIFGFSVWVTVSSLAQRLVFNITPSILGAFANSAAIAVFGIVSTIEGYAYTFTTAMNGMFMSKIARIYESEDSEKNLMPLFLSVGRFQFALNGLIVCGFIVVGQSFIRLWMDEGFEEAYAGILLVLIPGLFFNSLQIANTAMVVRKKVKHQALVNIVMGVLNVAISIPLTLKFGMLGSCVSIFVAYMVRAVAMHVISQKVLNLDLWQFIKKCYLRMGIPIFITVAVGLLINYFIAQDTWGNFVLRGTLVVICYLASVYIIGLDKNERSSCLRLIKKFTKKR